jgi:hypothetical protein
MLRLGDQGIDIPAGEPNYVITDSYVLPADVDVHAVQPHAHYRAREIRGFAKLPDGTTKWLIHIKDWDFRWQHVYRLVTPLRLPRGTTVAMQFTYDNSPANARNPERPPTRARWGQRSRDEMGDLPARDALACLLAQRTPTFGTARERNPNRELRTPEQRTLNRT